MIFAFLLQHIIPRKMLDYKTQHENRKSGSKDLAKSLLFLVIGLAASFMAYSVYMAFSRHPQAMYGILLFIGPFSLLWSFERIWWHKRKRVEAETRLFDFEQHKKEIIDAIISRIGSAGKIQQAPEPDIDRLLRLQGSTEEEILETLKHMAPDLNYYGITRLLEKYKDFPRVKGVLLNARKYWERDQSRDKYKTRAEIEGINPSPRTFELSPEIA